MRFVHDDYGLQCIYIRNSVDQKAKYTNQSHSKGPIVSLVDWGHTGVSSSSS
jgi:hypothetical protein